jgi:hypothetical protein
MVVEELRMDVVPGGQASGIVGGLAATATPLTDEPLSLMCQFTLRADDEQVAAAKPLFAGLSTGGIDVSLARDEARLGLIDLAGQTPQSVRTAIEDFAQALIATGLVTPNVCLRCGADENVQSIFHQGQTSLVCTQCLAAATAERQQRQLVLDRGSWSAFIGLPAAFTFAAAGWAVFWTLIDLAIGWLNVQVIDINKLTITLALIVVSVAGAGLGIPLGTLLRRSGAIRRAPEALAGLVVLGAAAAGELLYTAVVLFISFGLIDLRFAAQLLPMILRRYPDYMIVTKLALAFMIGVFCIMEAKKRPEARLEL